MTLTGILSQGMENLVFSQDDDRFMRRALELAEQARQADEVPVGALIVKNNQIISEAYNQREGLRQSTAHAEILAIQEACRKLGAWRLSGCTLYVTLEPCLMCAGAISQSRLDKIIYGARDPKGGAVDSLYECLRDTRLNHRCEVGSGLREQECSRILSDFFKQRRSKVSE